MGATGNMIGASRGRTFINMPPKMKITAVGIMQTAEEAITDVTKPEISTPPPRAEISLEKEAEKVRALPRGPAPFMEAVTVCRTLSFSPPALPLIALPSGAYS